MSSRLGVIHNFSCSSPEFYPLAALQLSNYCLAISGQCFLCFSIKHWSDFSVVVVQKSTSWSITVTLILILPLYTHHSVCGTREFKGHLPCCLARSNDLLPTFINWTIIINLQHHPDKLIAYYPSYIFLHI